MIKILATSDWHLGEYFHSSDRLKEQQHFLSWLKQEAATLQPDALLVAGDVFDNSNPSAAAQETYYNFLSEITEACPDMTIVVIAGNHDSATRLTAPAALLKKHHIEVRGRVDRQWIPSDNKPGEGQWIFNTENLIIPIYTKTKDERTWIAALPYVRNSELGYDNSYPQSMRKLITQLMTDANNRREANEAVIMMAHFYATGAEIANNSSENIIVGGLEQINVADMDTRPTCLICGHIHKRQAIWNTSWARYTGSPLSMSFAEKNNKHGIDLITIESGKMIDSPHFIEYTPQRRLIEIPEEGALPLEQVIRQIGQLPRKQQDSPETMSYVAVKLCREDIDLTSRKQISDELSKRHAIFSKLQCIEKMEVSQTADENKPTESSLDDIYQRNPLDAIIIGFIRENQIAISERQIQLAQTAINEAQNMNEEEEA